MNKKGESKGKTDAEIYSIQLSAKWGNYKEYIRNYMYPEDSIKGNTDLWWIRFKCSASEGQEPARGQIDPTSKTTLFTEETMDAFKNCHLKAHAIADDLSPEDLFMKVTPSKYSRSQLDTYIGMRGPESMGEKTHLGIAHYANGGMPPALVDALTFAGMANDNLRLRYYHDVLRLEKELRAEIPTNFGVPPHLNLSRLDYINKKACDKINFDVHKNVRPLPSDNKERYMSEYLVEQMKETKNTSQIRTVVACASCVVEEKKDN